MANPLIQEVNVKTGKDDVREMTAEEHKELLAAQARMEQDIELFNNKATAKANLLEKLGITEEEAKLLLA